MLSGQTIVISGGTGSFGRAFLKEALKEDVRQIRVYSRDELKQAQLKDEIKDRRLECLLGDVRDFERTCVALQGADIVIHAAALKRIEACEHDPQEAVKTNIVGSINIANACLRNDVAKAVLISTDKAVSPINLYGATKLVAEKAWIQSNTYRGLSHKTKFGVVRYGNVLGSRGSVLNLFKDQLHKGVIKVTDQRMTRFFITLQEAVDLVKLSLETMQGGEIYIPNLKAASIYHIAQLVAGTIPIEITSPRGGEKLHEVLVTQEENLRRSIEPGYSIIHPEITSWPYIKPLLSFAPDSAISSETAPQYEDKELRRLLASTL